MRQVMILLCLADRLTRGSVNFIARMVSKTVIECDDSGWTLSVMGERYLHAHGGTTGVGVNPCSEPEVIHP